MLKTILPIKGIHCRSCEMILGDKLKTIQGVKNARVSLKSKSAIIYHTKPIAESVFRLAIEEAGYAIGTENPKKWVSFEPRVWKDFLFALIVVLILYFAAKSLGFFRISFGNASNPTGISTVLLVGLTAGFSSCMALVGGLILGVSAKFAEKFPKATSVQKFRPHLFFNFGRIASFFLFGGMIGLMGKVFQLSGSILGLVTILIGVVMIFIGIQLIEIFPLISNINFSLPPSLSNFLGIKNNQEKEYSHTNSMLIGALTFFLPCGFTQAMQLYAISSSSFWSGAAIMLLFAVGTTPGLLGIGGLSAMVQGVFAKRFFKVAGIIVIALAILNISNGFSLAGFQKYFHESNNLQVHNIVTNNNGTQVIKMRQDAKGYTPNNFTVKVGQPVEWVIESTNSNVCSASLYSEKLKINQYLKIGQNTINFTPGEAGIIPFSCSMGMYRGSIEVVN